ncbi:MAG: hypothetical protein L0I29_02120 [Hyphomicrobiales bacterium]|nr:hypothetical protein [Hyphomicrobiales bacterium]
MESFVPGDIVEIETPRGLAYVQVTHDHRAYPQVVRALPDFYPKRPDLDALARGKASFVAMVQLSEAGGTMRKAGSAPIPEADRPFPTFKMEIRDKIDGVRKEVAYWWFWDGEGLTYDTNPNTAMRNLPPREVLSAKRLVERMCKEPAAAEHHQF